MYKELLSKVKNLQKRSKIISDLKQESFNIFSILRKEYDEEKLHSVFLSELLNPKGSHSLGNRFAKLFFEEILESEFDYANGYQVLTEKKIEEGRTDIYIRNSKGQTIVIENKIYAADQTKQLIRYSNHSANFSVSRLELYYLTLDGKDANEESTKDKEVELISGIDYLSLSYRSDIIEWMELCQKEVVDYPTLRETIKQYITLIKKLTGQLTDTLMEKEIYSEIKKHYKSAKLISDNLWKVRENEVLLFMEELKDKINDSLSDEWTVYLGDVKERWNGIDIRHSNWIEGVGVKLEGQSRVTVNNSIIGVYAHNKKFDREEVNSFFKDTDSLKSGFKSSEYWPFYKYVVNFGRSPDIDKLFDDKEREKLKNSIANQMIKLAKECKIPLENVKNKAHNKVQNG